MTKRHIGLGVVITMHSDMDKSIEFYNKLLGVEKPHLYIKGEWADYVLVNGIKFGLVPTDQKFESIRTGFILEVYEDLRKLYKEMKDDGFTFMNEPIETPHGVMVTVKDPCGNVIDLHQPTPEVMKQFTKAVLEREAAEIAAKEQAKSDA